MLDDPPKSPKSRRKTRVQALGGADDDKGEVVLELGEIRGPRSNVGDDSAAPSLSSKRENTPPPSSSAAESPQFDPPRLESPTGSGSSRGQAVRARLARVVQAFKSETNRDTAKEAPEEEEEDNIMHQTVETRRRIQKAKKVEGILADDSWVPIWEIALLVVTLYFEISSTLHDIYDNWYLPVQLPLDTAGSLIFLADTVIRGNMLSKEGDSTTRNVAKYLQTWFILDIISSIPFHLICLSLGWRVAQKLLYHLPVLRVLRSFTYFKQVNPEAISPRYIYVYYQVVPLVQMLFWTLFCLHIFVIVRLALIGSRRQEKDSYATATYYVLYTVTTVGYGDVPVDTTGERIFACFLFIFGTFANAAIIGQLSKVMRANDIKSERKARMVETLAVMEYFSIPKTLQQEVLAFQNHILQHNVGSSYSKIMDGLPHSMQQHIGLYVRIKFIGTVGMFQSATRDCKVALAEVLKNVVYAPGQYIIKAGDVGMEMFFMGHGYADVLSSDGMHLATIKKGGFFGEIALLIETLRTASIRALTYCDLFRLDKRDFLEILDSFPAFNEQIQTEIRLRKEQMEQKEQADKEKEIAEHGDGEAAHHQRRGSRRRSSEVATFEAAAAAAAQHLSSPKERGEIGSARQDDGDHLPNPPLLLPPAPPSTSEVGPAASSPKKLKPDTNLVKFQSGSALESIHDDGSQNQVVHNNSSSSSSNNSNNNIGNMAIINVTHSEDGSDGTPEEHHLPNPHLIRGQSLHGMSTALRQLQRRKSSRRSMLNVPGIVPFSNFDEEDETVKVCSNPNPSLQKGESMGKWVRRGSSLHHPSNSFKFPTKPVPDPGTTALPSHVVGLQSTLNDIRSIVSGLETKMALLESEEMRRNEGNLRLQGPQPSLFNGSNSSSEN